MLEGNDCTQDTVAKWYLPSTGDTTTKYAESGDFTNDEIRSMALVGPLDPGAQVEVFDSPSIDSTSIACRDDYGSVVLTSPLAAYETLCVGTFERSIVESKYQQSYWEISSVFKLDGQVSTVVMKNTGDLSNNDFNRCYGDSRFVFYEGNDCTENVVGELTPPATGDTKNGNIPNDEARSVLVVGPLWVGQHLMLFLVLKLHFANTRPVLLCRLVIV